MRPIIGWIVAAAVICAVIIFALVTEGWWGVWVALIQMGAIGVGALVGGLLMREAYERFSWGESAARSIYHWVLGSGIILFLLVLVLEPVLGVRIGNELTLAAIGFWTVFGLWVGCMSRAKMIHTQLRTEERSPP
jgi:hypothetical protein